MSLSRCVCCRDDGHDQAVEIYEASDGQSRIDARLDGAIVWLSRQQLSELFGRDVKTIAKHVNNDFREG